MMIYFKPSDNFLISLEFHNVGFERWWIVCFLLSEMDESNYMEKITPRPIWNLMRQLQASFCRLLLDFLSFLLCYFLSRYNMFSGILWSGILMFIASDQLYTIFLLKIPNRRKTAHDNEKFMLIDHQQLCACCWQGSRDMTLYIITCLHKNMIFMPLLQSFSLISNYRNFHVIILKFFKFSLFLLFKFMRFICLKWKYYPCYWIQLY